MDNLARYNRLARVGFIEARYPRRGRKLARVTTDLQESASLKHGAVPRGPTGRHVTTDLQESASLKLQLGIPRALGFFRYNRLARVGFIEAWSATQASGFPGGYNRLARVGFIEAAPHPPGWPSAWSYNRLARVGFIEARRRIVHTECGSWLQPTRKSRLH